MISIYQNGKSANPADLPKAAVEKLQLQELLNVLVFMPL